MRTFVGGRFLGFSIAFFISGIFLALTAQFTHAAVAGCANPDPNVWNHSFTESFDAPLDYSNNWFKYSGNQGGRVLNAFNPANHWVESGFLNMMLDKKPFNDRQYSGTGLGTRKGYYSTTYGRIEMVAKGVKGSGQVPYATYWPEHGGWTAEIDFFEMVGRDPDHVFQTNHWFIPPTGSGREHRMRSVNTDLPTIADEFHTYTVEWTPDKIDFFVDCQLAGTITEGIPHENQVIGIGFGYHGTESWAGPADDSKLPSIFQVDSIRAWTYGREDGTVPPPPTPSDPTAVVGGGTIGSGGTTGGTSGGTGVGLPQGFTGPAFDPARPITNLANERTMLRTNLSQSGRGRVQNMWDGCITESTDECVSSISGSDSFWIEYDLGEDVDLGVARLFGDDEPTYISKTWELHVRNNQSDPWRPVAEEAVAEVTNWVEKYVGEEARYVRLTVHGAGDGTAQAREFELFPADDPRNQTGVSSTFDNITRGFSTLFSTLFPFGDDSNTDQSGTGDTVVTPTAQGVPASSDGDGTDAGVVTPDPTGNILTPGMISRSSDNFRTDRGPDKLLDNCFGDQDITCMAGNVDIGSFWVEFDLGESHILEEARLFGDTFGTWVSTAWTIEYRADDTSNWSVLFRDVDAYGNQWFSQPLSNVEAQHVRLTVTGDTEISRTQAREFALVATPASGAVVTPPTPGVPGSGDATTGGSDDTDSPDGNGGTADGTGSGSGAVDGGSSGGTFGFLSEAWQTGTEFIGDAVNNLLSYFDTPSASGVIFIDTFDEDSKAGPLVPNPVLGLGYSTNYTEAHLLSKWTKWDSKAADDPTQGFWVIPPGETFMVQAGRSARSVLFANTPVPPGTFFYDIQFDQWASDNDYIGYIINAPAQTMVCHGGGCDSGGVEFGYMRQTPGTDDWVEEGHVSGDLGERVVPGIGLPHRFQWKSHRIEVRGTSISWYIDNELIISGVVPDMPSGGYFGIRQQFDRNTRYDNVVITRIDAPAGFFDQATGGSGGTTGGTTGGTSGGTGSGAITTTPAPIAGNFNINYQTGQILDTNGNVFVPKGVNVWSFSPPGDAELNSMRSCWGFNFVRMMVEGVPDATTYAAIDKFLDAGMVVAPWPHTKSSYPGGEWTEDRLLNLFLRPMAERYKDNPRVWFNSYGEWGDSSSNDAGRSRQYVDYHQKVVRLIRDDIGANNIIMADAGWWAQDMTFAGCPAPSESISNVLSGGPQIVQFDGKTYPNILFDVHIYGNWTCNAGERITDYLNKTRAKGLAVIFAEFGSIRADGIDFMPATRGMYQALQSHPHVGRAVWHWNAQFNDLVQEAGSDTREGGRGDGDHINSCTNPTNLTPLGELVWDDTH